MKNKKLLMRIFALLASLVFVVALAVPCFADAQTDDKDYVINSITFTDGDSAYQWLTENFQRVIKVSLASGGVTIGTSSDFTVLADSSFNISIFAFTDLVDDGGSSSRYAKFAGGFCNINSENIQLTISPIVFDIESGQSTSFSGSSPVIIPHSYSWSAPEIGLTMVFEYTTEYVPKENTTRSGMFGQLYNILRDAIFGKDVLLDDSQDFVLTQISTWMTYIVILLPLLVVGIILYRVFVR